MKVSVIYSVESAQYTNTVEWLSSHTVPYTTRCIREDPAARAEVRQRGHFYTPVVIVTHDNGHDSSWSGFWRNKLEEALMPITAS